MSIRIIARVLPKRWGSPARKVVAIKLADVADDAGAKIFPSVATVAAEAELSERQVKRVLEEFRTEGLLIVVKKGGGRSRSTEYRLSLEAIDVLPDAKPLHEPQEGENSDRVSPYREINSDTVSPNVSANSDKEAPFQPETVTSTTQNSDRVSPNPSLPLRIPSSKEGSASAEAGADAPSVSAKIWKEGKDLLNATSSKTNPSIIGKWLKRTPTDHAKEQLLAMIRAAAKAGTADPVGYVTAALGREFPPPADPKGFDAASWSRNVQAAIKTKAWAATWGPPPGKPGCLLPKNMISRELIAALSERRIAA